VWHTRGPICGRSHAWEPWAPKRESTHELPCRLPFGGLCPRIGPQVSISKWNHSGVLQLGPNLMSRILWDYLLNILDQDSIKGVTVLLQHILKKRLNENLSYRNLQEIWVSTTGFHEYLTSSAVGCSYIYTYSINIYRTCMVQWFKKTVTWDFLKSLRCQKKGLGLYITSFLYFIIT